MRKIATLTALLALILSVPATAQVRFAYDVTFDSYFDNRENDRSGNALGTSLTLFGARLSPEIGFNACKDGERAMRHRLMLGVDIEKDFGSREKIGQLFKEIRLWYHLDGKIGEKCTLDLNAGIFPRTAGKGRYSDIFFSDSLRFYDPNHEGLLFGFTRPGSYYEVGVDWMGQFGTDPATREKFMIFSSGYGRVLGWMTIGYSAYMLHYANSKEVKGLVDNLLGSAYIETDFGAMAGMQRLSLTLEYIQAMQRDRRMVGKFVFPMGGEITAEVRNWNVGIRNRLFGGSCMMPYYNSLDAGGNKYGAALYCGDPWYRVTKDGRPGIYDRIEAYWEPCIARGLHFRIGAMFHFNSGLGYSGCSQTVALRCSLEEIVRAYGKKN